MKNIALVTLIILTTGVCLCLLFLVTILGKTKNHVPQIGVTLLPSNTLTKPFEALDFGIVESLAEVANLAPDNSDGTIVALKLTLGQKILHVVSKGNDYL